MRLNGTSVVKFEDFVENLKYLAGTCFITRSEYDASPNKICSFSHINKNFNLTWNALLEQAGVPIKHEVSFPIKQGRKVKDKALLKDVECLRCGREFKSIDPKINRICDRCKIGESWEE